MPHRPDLPCADCGKLLWRSTTSLPLGQATCLPCRRARRGYASIKERNRQYQAEARARSRKQLPPKPPLEWQCCVCGQLVLGGPLTRNPGKYCDVHRRLAHAKFNRDKGHRRRARKYGVLYRYTSPQSIFDRDGWHCGICSDPVDKQLRYPDPMSASLDHVVPISLGGDHVASNLQCAHLRCNMLKSNRYAGGAA